MPAWVRMSHEAFTFGLSPAQCGLVALATLCLIAGAWLIARHSRKPQAPAAPPEPAETEEFDARALQLDIEAAAILRMVRSYLDAGEKYSVTLAQADRKLPAIASPDEVGIIVKFLIAQNARMQQEATDLKKNLEQSRSQIDKLRSNLAEAREMGMRDPLTGVSNRRCFDINLAQVLDEARVGGHAMCLVMGDIDNFKKVNDAFGHQIGDEILRLFAGVLSRNIGTHDLIARYGGEEFAIILPHAEIKDARTMAERVRRDLETRHLAINESGEAIGKITASFGIAQLSDADDAEKLIQRADARLYAAKCAGRNRIAADDAIAA